MECVLDDIMSLWHPGLQEPSDSNTRVNGAELK